MDGAAHLFVEEHVLGEAGDAVVGADAELAQGARAGVAVELGGQQFLVLAGGLFDHPAVLEPQLDVGDFLPVFDGRIFEAHPAVDRSLPPDR